MSSRGRSPFGTARPYPGNLIRCPKCGHRSFDYMAKDYGACERRQCAYEWRPDPQLVLEFA